jgi:hypothetical protein
MIDYDKYKDSFKLLIEEQGRLINLININEKEAFINYIVSYISDKIDKKAVDIATINELEFIKKYISFNLSGEVDTLYSLFLKQKIINFLEKNIADYDSDSFKITSETPNFWSLLNSKSEVLKTKPSKSYIDVLKLIFDQDFLDNKKQYNALILFYITTKQTDLSDLIIKAYMLS